MKHLITPLSAAIAGLLLSGAAIAQTTQATDVGTPKVDQRQARQEQRIDAGVASGELTRRETRRLNAEQRQIERSETRAKADGKVTRAERYRLHKQQDRASRHIARQKHDRQDRPQPPNPGQAGG
jgi:hypothetical protein